MPERVESADPDGVDFTWVMQTTFVLTVVVGPIVVVLLSFGVSLPTWQAKAEFAIRVGAVIWLITALGVYGYERWQNGSEASNSQGPG